MSRVFASLDILKKHRNSHQLAKTACRAAARAMKRPQSVPRAAGEADGDGPGDMGDRPRTISTNVTEMKTAVKTKAKKTNNQALFGGSILKANMEV
jgi:hypothetical protein